MNLRQLIVEVRRKVGDMGEINWTNPEVIYAINNAIEYISISHIDAEDPEYISKIIIPPHEDVRRPKDFYSFVGQELFEFERKGNAFYLQPLDYDHEYPVVCRYYALRPKVEDLEDEIPFSSRHEQEELISAAVEQLMGPDSSQQQGGATQ